MSILCKLKKYLEIVRKCYIVAFITYLLLSRVVMFVNIITLPVNSLIYNMFAFVGIAILVWDFFTNFYQFKSIENIMLVLFMIVCLISSVINIKYGIANNFKTMVWMCIQFFILFSSLHVKDKKYIQSMFNVIMKITTFIWFITSLISLAQFFFVIQYKAPFSGYPRRQGFVDNRLFGVYSDPNFAAVTSIVVIIFAVFLCKRAKSKKTKIFHILNIIVQVMYIILSGSRTGHIELVMIAGMLAVVLVRNRGIDKESRFINIKAITAAISAMIVIIVGIKVLPPQLIEIAKSGNEIKNEFFADSQKPVTDNNNDEQVDENQDKVEIKLEREDLKEDNISNNRFKIWASAVEISKENRLFGVSPRNMIAYAKATHPDSYIATTEYETHNGYVAIFVYTGVAGTLVVMSLVIYLVWIFICYLKRMLNVVYSDEIIISTFVCIVIAASSVMLLDVFFVNTVSAALFWFSAGCFVYLTKNENKK